MLKEAIAKQEIRRLTAADAPALGKFFAALAGDAETVRFFHPHPLSREYAATLCARAPYTQDRYFVMWRRGEVIGYSMLRGWDEGYEIPKFGAAVHPAHRNAGAGRALLAHAIAESRAAGAPKLLLSVYEENLRAVHVYRTFGFVLEDQGNGSMKGTLDLQSASQPAREQRAA